MDANQFIRLRSQLRPGETYLLRIMTIRLLRAGRVGASLLVQWANLTLVDTEFFGNFADEYGGAIVQLDAGLLNAHNTTFDFNTANYAGGALAIASASGTDR